MHFNGFLFLEFLKVQSWMEENQKVYYFLNEQIRVENCGLQIAGLSRHAVEREVEGNAIRTWRRTEQ